MPVKGVLLLKSFVTHQAEMWINVFTDTRNVYFSNILVVFNSFVL